MAAMAVPDRLVTHDDTVGRADALDAAWLAGACSGATMGLHHKPCHVLGGILGLPHLETHAVALPHGGVSRTPPRPTRSRRTSRQLTCTETHLLSMQTFAFRQRAQQ